MCASDCCFKVALSLILPCNLCGASSAVLLFVSVVGIWVLVVIVMEAGGDRIGWSSRGRFRGGRTKTKLPLLRLRLCTPRKQRVTNFGHPLIWSSFGPDKDQKLTLGPSAISGQSYLLTDFRPGGI